MRPSATDGALEEPATASSVPAIAPAATAMTTIADNAKRLDTHQNVLRSLAQYKRCAGLTRARSKGGFRATAARPPKPLRSSGCLARPHRLSERAPGCPPGPASAAP